MSEPTNKIVEQYHSGFFKNFAVTGTLKRFTRDQIIDKLLSHHINVTDDVSTKTDVLICGKEAGTKLSRALELGVQIWSEETLMKFLSEVEGD